MKKLVWLTVFVSCISQVNVETELEEKAKVLSTLKKYSETVACNTNFEEKDSLEPFLKDVHSIERNTEAGPATYYVLWSGDMGVILVQLHTLSSLVRSVERQVRGLF